MYKKVDTQVSFPKLEEDILAFWEQNRMFERSLEKGGEDFVMYDGPPFATGLPHFGHFVPGTVKDVIPRYQTMKGKRVERRFGWDCHGLPIEYEMEKELGISGRAAVEDFGVANFNEHCRSIVLRYTKEWEKTVKRLGRWVDFKNDYKTMEPEYMESIWWVVKSLWDQDLIYEGHYILPACPRCSTVLSNHELNMGGYKDVHDPAVTVAFKSLDIEDTYFLAWTTTPWTLPSNLGLVVGPEMNYVKIRDVAEDGSKGDKYYILCEDRLAAYYKDAAQYEIVERYVGADLEGKSYEPLFDYFAGEAEHGAFQVRLGDFVTTDGGTGIVHTAPGFGEDDYAVFKGTDITIVCPIDDECRFTKDVADYEGRFVKECDKDIVARLKTEGKLIKRENYLHSYPHCWRCDSPLIYRAISSWFVHIDRVKDKMLKANDQIRWVPGHLQAGRFGKWLENARDWAISRNRFWGNPIPIWRCDSCDDMTCVGSRKELEALTGEFPKDLHKHFVDELSFACACGGTKKRIPEVLDCWFESGSMPYAQNHYPFENKELVEEHLPADFICEGLDQTRGWFYTLVILAAALFDRPAFANVVVNGLVLAADGKKMSKSLRNYSDPNEVIDSYGADALRFFLMNSQVVKGEEVRFSDESVKEVLKSVLIPLWNAYSFFVSYANIDEYEAKGNPFEAIAANKDSVNSPLDTWIISETEKLIADVTESLDNYDIYASLQPILAYIDGLNNWYIRRSRRRFWRSGSDADKVAAYETLHYALMSLIKVAAPVIPFVTEAIYQNLKSEGMPDSIHLCDYPVARPEARDMALELEMSLARQVVSMGRSLRSQLSIRTRQPLSALHIVSRNEEAMEILRSLEELIKEELNVKAVHYRDDETALVTLSAKANFKLLGRELGPHMKEVAAAIQALAMEDIVSILKGEAYSLSYSAGELVLTPDHLIIHRQEREHLSVINQGDLTLALETEMSDELRMEGVFRDVVRWVQNQRKEQGLEITDRIRLSISGSDAVKAALDMHRGFLSTETLCDELIWEDNAKQELLPTEEEVRVAIIR